MVHLVKFFLLSKNMNVGILSVGVLKLAITIINCVKCLHEAGGKINICIGSYFWHILTSPLQL